MFWKSPKYWKNLVLWAFCEKLGNFLIFVLQSSILLVKKSSFSQIDSKSFPHKFQTHLEFHRLYFVHVFVKRYHSLTKTCRWNFVVPFYFCDISRKNFMWKLIFLNYDFDRSLRSNVILKTKKCWFYGSTRHLRT